MSSAASGGTMGGRYTLTDRIAAGGMGEVWQAKDEVLGRTVALKVLKAGLTEDSGFTDRFRNEARLSAALTHGNIAQVYDYGEDDGTAYLVMEYVPGRPLSKLIEERAPMSPVDTVEIIAQASAALQAAHKGGLIHRDVKPANILIDPEGTAKLTDFGIARAADAVAMTKTGEVMGTAQYLAPEAAVGRPATGLSDVYALGVVAYEMLAGRRPFEADSAVVLALAHVNEPPPSLPPYVPPPVRAVVHAALEKNPARRPQSAAEFGRAMRQALRDSDRLGFLGPRGQRGPMGAQGPRALSNEQRAQRHPGPSSGPQGPGRPGPGGLGRGPAAPRSGPQPTGVQPAGPSGPQRGPTSGPQRTGSVPGQRPAGPSGPQRTGSIPGQRPSGPQGAALRGAHSGPQRQIGPAPRQGTSGPQAGVSPTSGPQAQTRASRLASAAATKTDGPKSTGTAKRGLSRNQVIGLAGLLVAIVLVVVLVVALTGRGDDETPSNPNEPQDVQTSFQSGFTTVSMPTSAPDRSAV